MEHPKQSNDAAMIAEKTMLIRKSIGITQSDLAAGALLPEKRVTRVENGKDYYKEDEIKPVKEFLGIAGMPLTVFECETFKGRLYIWRDVMRERNIKKAKEMQVGLQNVVRLDPCDNDLPILYRLFEVSLLVAENKMDVAKEKLDFLESIFGRMNTEHLYSYNFQKGFYYATKDDFENALIYYRKALNIRKNTKDILPDDEERLYYSLAVCYTEIEQPSRAIAFLGEMPKSIFGNKETALSLGVDILKAINLYKIGLPDEAEYILNNCFSHATSAEDEFYIGLSLHNLGRVHRYSKNWEKAIEYFGKALNHFEENTYLHAWALYYKIRCMMETTKLNDLERELIKIAKSLENNDNYTIFLETLRYSIYLNRSMSRYNPTAVDYIENVAIPYFIKDNSRLEALDCYSLLERLFIKNRQQKKSLEANRAMLEIRERMI
ncbi:MAG: tetratricopeptide repeat protein [Defluviitaleaceae bacterium]|nr:tetratricopeptide repeat protein [Defluviitaleaceae bacterium]